MSRNVVGTTGKIFMANVERVRERGTEEAYSLHLGTNL